MLDLSLGNDEFYHMYIIFKMVLKTKRRVVSDWLSSFDANTFNIVAKTMSKSLSSYSDVTFSSTTTTSLIFP